MRLSISFAAMMLLPGLALAQESIDDPENVAPEGDATYDTIGETIVDPENTTPEQSEDAPSTAETQPTEESIFDAENSGSEESIFDEENSSNGAESISHSSDLHGPEQGALDSPADAQEPSNSYEVSVVGGYQSSAFFDTYIETLEEDIIEWRNQLSLSIDVELSPHWRFFVGAELEHWTLGKRTPDVTNVYVNASDVRTDAHLRLAEAFVVYRTGDWTFAGGNMLTRWGSTDLIRPSDVINPVDQTAPLGPGAVPRIPQLTLDASVQTGPVNLQFIVVPFFKADRVSLFGRDTALLNVDTPLGSQVPVAAALEQFIDNSLQSDIQPFLFVTEQPQDHPGNISVGTRVSATLANTDLALGYFFGFDRTPTTEFAEPIRIIWNEAIADGRVLQDLDILSFLARRRDAFLALNEIPFLVLAGEPLVRSRYERRHFLSVEAARYIGPIGVRTDVAFTPAQTYFTSNLGSVRRPTLFAALGLSYERIQHENDALTVTVEGFFTHAFSHDSSVTELFVDASRAGDGTVEPLFFDDSVYGIAGAIVWAEPFTESTLTLGARSDFANQDLILSVSAAHRWSTLLQTSLGVTVFEGYGDDLSLGGALDRNDAFWVSVSGAL